MCLAKSKEELNRLFRKVKEESEKIDLKLRSWHLVHGKWGKHGTMTDFIFLGSKIIVDGDCSHKIKRHLLLGRKTMTNLGSKAMTNLDSILKRRDITC